MEEKLSYTEALGLYDDEIEEANLALDYYIELCKKANKKGGK